MADLGPKKIGSNYQKLLQISSSTTENGIILDGTGSAFALRLSGSSNVGIGTNPVSGYSLFVDGAISASNLAVDAGTIYIGGVTQSAEGGNITFYDSSSNEMGAFQGDGYFTLSSSVETGGVGRPLFNMSQQVGSTQNVNIAQIKLSSINFYQDGGGNQWMYGAQPSGSTYQGDFFLNDNFTQTPQPGGTLQYPAFYITASNKYWGIGTFPNSTNMMRISGSLFVDGPVAHITASGNISASGTIYASAFSSPGGDGDIDLSNSLDVTGNITASGDIWVSGSGDILLDEDQRIYFEEDKQTWIESNGANLFRIVTNNNQMLLLDHETGNRAVFGNGAKVFIGDNNNALPDKELVVHGDVSASGDLHINDITASGNSLFGSNHLYSHTFDGHITASGNISSSKTGSFAKIKLGKFPSWHSGGTEVLTIHGNISASGVFATGSGDVIATNISASGDIFNIGNKTRISASGDIELGGTFGKKLYFNNSWDNYMWSNGTGQIDLVVNDTAILKATDDRISVTGHISASGTIYGDGSGLTGINTGEWYSLGSTITSSKDIQVDGVVSASKGFHSMQAGGDITTLFGNINTEYGDINSWQGNIYAKKKISTPHLNLYENQFNVHYDGAHLLLLPPISDPNTNANIGINTANPTEKLTLAGNLFVTESFFQGNQFNWSAGGNIITSGHITASGNISSSANITSNVINVGTRVKAINTTLEFAGDQLDFVDSGVTSYHMRVSENGINVTNHITASGDISASGDLYAHSASFGGFIDAGKITQATITAHGDISASGVIIGDGGISGSNATLSGNISSNGTGSFDYISVTNDISSSGGLFGNLPLSGSKVMKSGEFYYATGQQLGLSGSHVLSQSRIEASKFVLIA